MNDLHQHNGHESYYHQTSSFCDPSMSMSMYMDGLKWSYFFTDGKSHCLNLIFPSFTLNTKGTFLFGMICVMFLGISLEYISIFRMKYIAKMERRHRDDDAADAIPSKVQLTLTCLQGLQVLSGYIMMLVIMTYSIELILSAVGGFMIGFYVFYKQKMMLKSELNDGRTQPLAGMEELNISSNATPCCREYGSEPLPQTSSFDYSRLRTEDSNDSGRRVVV